MHFGHLRYCRPRRLQRYVFLSTYKQLVAVVLPELQLLVVIWLTLFPFIAVRDQYMRTGDGFLCVYSITLQASFDEAVSLHDHILRVKDSDSVPFVLGALLAFVFTSWSVTF